MKKTLSAKLNSYLVVQSLLLASKAIVAVLPALEEAIDALVDLILEINLNIKIQASPSGAAQAKKDALQEAGDLAFEVAGGVLAFADKQGPNGDPNLAARVRYARTPLTAGGGNAVVARLQGVIDAAAENIDALKDYGVTPEKLKALKQKVKIYDTLRVLPRDAIGAAAAATRALERLFPQVDRLLDNQVDRLMWQFRTSTPDFYDRYLSARSIVQPPTRTKEEEPAAEATPAVPASATANASPSPTASSTPEPTVTVVPRATPGVEASAPASPVRNGTPSAAAPETKSA